MAAILSKPQSNKHIVVSGAAIRVQGKMVVILTKSTIDDKIYERLPAVHFTNIDSHESHHG